MEGSKEFLYIRKINPPKTAIELLDLTYFFPLPAVWGLKKKIRIIWMYIHLIPVVLLVSSYMALESWAPGEMRAISCPKAGPEGTDIKKILLTLVNGVLDASWKLVPGASPLQLPSFPSSCHKSLSIKYCLYDPPAPTLAPELPVSQKTAN